MKQQAIELATRDGKEIVQGYVIGRTGVHRSISYGKTWDLTHLPTGHTLGIKFSFRTRAQAVEMAKAVEELVGRMNAWAGSNPFAAFDCLLSVKDEIGELIDRIGTK